MRELLRGRPIPTDHFEAQRVFEAAFVEVVGAAPSCAPGAVDALYVERFRTGSGISDGTVSLHFWACTAIPILIDRAGAAGGW